MIHREQNRITFEGTFGIGDLLTSLAALHQAVQAGYQDLILDFSACTAAFAPPMLATCCQVMKLRNMQVEFERGCPDRS